MREIKFRAWDNVKKEWLLGYEYENLGGFSIDGECVMLGEWSSILNQMLRGDFGERGEELKVMQYTGLKDAKGVEIYEGDIIRGYYEGGVETWEVAMEDDRDMNGWNVTGQNVEDGMEVIGNIYENPELIK